MCNQQEKSYGPPNAKHHKDQRNANQLPIHCLDLCCSTFRENCTPLTNLFNRQQKMVCIVTFFKLHMVLYRAKGINSVDLRQQERKGLCGQADDDTLDKFCLPNEKQT